MADPQTKARFIEPMLLVRTNRLPEGAAWGYEVKFDKAAQPPFKALQNCRSPKGTAVIRTLIETAPRPRASSAARQAATVVLVKAGLGSWPYQAKNSSRPRLYTRFVIGEETESRTKDFSRRQSAPLSTSTISFIWNLLMGIIGSRVDLTSKR